MRSPLGKLLGSMVLPNPGSICQSARVTPHDLRHTAASLVIRGGANPKAVQTMLGHQSAALTLDTYADLFPQ